MSPGGPAFSSAAGRVLAAMPALTDPNFHQVLVFVAEHDDKGALGFVLNRPLHKKLAEVARGPAVSDALGQAPVYYGGPVQSDRILLVLYQAARKGGGIRCRPGLPLEQLEAHMDDGASWVRAYSGYAGWGVGQLDRELREGAWKVCDADATLFEERLVGGLWPFFISGDARWKSLIPHLPRESDSN
jgi:putative transcriptional regulator